MHEIPGYTNLDCEMKAEPTKYLEMNPPIVEGSESSEQCYYVTCQHCSKYHNPSVVILPMGYMFLLLLGLSQSKDVILFANPGTIPMSRLRMIDINLLKG